MDVLRNDRLGPDGEGDLGRRDSLALAGALAVAIGVSCSDLTFTILRSGGRRLVGEGGLRWIRTGPAALLVVIGAPFVVQGVGG